MKINSMSTRLSTINAHQRGQLSSEGLRRKSVEDGLRTDAPQGRRSMKSVKDRNMNDEFVLHDLEDIQRLFKFLVHVYPKYFPDGKSYCKIIKFDKQYSLVFKSYKELLRFLKDRPYNSVKVFMGKDNIVFTFRGGHIKVQVMKLTDTRMVMLIRELYNLSYMVDKVKSKLEDKWEALDLDL